MFLPWSNPPPNSSATRFPVAFQAPELGVALNLSGPGWLGSLSGDKVVSQFGNAKLVDNFNNLGL